MQHARRAKGKDLEVVELLWSISQSQEVSTEACFREFLPLFLAKCVWYAGVRDLISFVHAIVVGDDS